MKKDSIQTRKRKPKQSSANSPSQLQTTISSNSQPYSIPLKLGVGLGMASGMPSGLIQSNSTSKLMSTRNYPNFSTITPLAVQSGQYSTGSAAAAYYTTSANDVVVHSGTKTIICHRHWLITTSPTIILILRHLMSAQLAILSAIPSSLTTAELMPLSSLSGANHAY